MKKLTKKIAIVVVCILSLSIFATPVLADECESCVERHIDFIETYVRPDYEAATSHQATPSSLFIENLNISKKGWNIPNSNLHLKPKAAGAVVTLSFSLPAF